MSDFEDPPPSNTEPVLCEFCRETVPPEQASRVRFDGAMVWVHHARCPGDRPDLRVLP